MKTQMDQTHNKPLDNSWKQAAVSLEYNKLLQLIAKRAKGQPGIEKINRLYPEENQIILSGLRKRINETMQAIMQSQMFSMAPYDSCTHILRELKIEGIVLDLENLLAVRNLLRQIDQLQQWFNTSANALEARNDRYPKLFELIEDLLPAIQLLKPINRVLDEDGHIKPDASPELMRLRKYQISKRSEINKVFQQTIQKNRKQGWLTDTVESVRNGRRVLSLPAEHKRKLRGIIHDESASGKTAFVEPEEIIELNNELFDAEMAERREIYKILAEITAGLSKHHGMLLKYEAAQTSLDLVQSIAHTATAEEWFIPEIKEEPQIDIRKGYHPLLKHKNSRMAVKTIPFSLETFSNNIIVLSGPNAGGKSITLKSVGLLVIMALSGLPIPANEDSIIGNFHHLLVDIGDKQSLEDDLSTYSSHLLQMKKMLEYASDRSLLLIDEFGAGTDPEFGGAIAESLLHEFRKRKATCLVTTHFSNLKLYAHKTSGVENACMLFDMDTMQPTFKLVVGKPGSSFAFEIAERTGLPKQILKNAIKNSGTQKHQFDQLLAQLQQEKQNLAALQSTANESKIRAEKLIANYEQLHRELEFRRIKLKLESKKDELQYQDKLNKELTKIVKELKEEKDLEKVKQIAKDKLKEKENLTLETEKLQTAVKTEMRSRVKPKGPIKAGDQVKLLDGSANGLVESVKRNKAIIIVGSLRMTVPLNDLQHAGEMLDVNNVRSVQTDLQSNYGNVNQKLDLRGMHKQEANEILQEYLDKALVANLSSLYIIHGKGDGVLRKVVHAKLREYPDIRLWEHEPEDAGGDGVTIIRF